MFSLAHGTIGFKPRYKVTVQFRLFTIFALLVIVAASQAQQPAQPRVGPSPHASKNAYPPQSGELQQPYSAHPYIDYQTKMVVDVDGAPNTYGPPDKPTLDTLRNAQLKNDATQIVGYVLDENKQPVVQTAHDPYPGYYVSTTAFCDNCDGDNARDPARYIDATKVNYVVLGSFGHRRGVRLGDLAAVHCSRTNRTEFAVVGDDGNQSGGEGSLHLLQELGYPFIDGRDGTAPREEITVRYYPQSNPTQKFFHTQAEIDAEAKRLGLNADFSSASASPKSDSTAVPGSH